MTPRAAGNKRDAYAAYLAFVALAVGFLAWAAPELARLWRADPARERAREVLAPACAGLKPGEHLFAWLLAPDGRALDLGCDRRGRAVVYGDLAGGGKPKGVRR